MIDEFKQKYEKIVERYQNIQSISTANWFNYSTTFDDKGDKKQPSKLKEAASILFEHLTEHLTKEKIDNHDLEPNHLSVYRLRDGTTAFLHNATRDIVKETSGFLEFKPEILLKMVISVITANFDTLTMIFLTIAEIFSGGALNIVITGVLLFILFIEEIHFSTFWWQVLQVIFFVKFFTKVLLSQSSIYMILFDSDDGLQRQFLGFINMFYGSLSPYSDAYAQVLIIWLIFFLKREGVDIANKYMYDNPGLCTTRVIYS